MFRPLSQQLRARLRARVLEFKGLKGLCLVAKEGFNGTVSGEAEDIIAFKNMLRGFLGAGLDFKDSTFKQHPFKKLKCKIKPHIVPVFSGMEARVCGVENAEGSGWEPGEVKSLNGGTNEANTCRLAAGAGGVNTGRAALGAAGYLEPKEWERVLASGEYDYLLDVRNGYECDVGAFSGARHFGLRHFKDWGRAFGVFSKKHGLGSGSKVLMYCTGGVRCERAADFMRGKGFSNVHQLKGGILRYLETQKQTASCTRFEGECFVFDGRVAVDNNLGVKGRWGICVWTGQPGDKKSVCVHCGAKYVVCSEYARRAKESLCSKNCAHHRALGHKFRRAHRDSCKTHLS